MEINKIIDEAYSLYMPQEREEIVSLAKFVNNLQPKVVVEIGSKFGGTLHIWCSLTKGKVISIDLVEGIHGGITREQFNERNLNFLNKFSNVNFIEGNSHDDTTYEMLCKVLNGDKIDFLFIDGDHTYEGVRQDYEMYSSLVHKGGYIAFHDINDTERHRQRNVYVGEFWNELEGEKIEFNAHSDWAGIGIIKHN
jgi:cephalosporin hydroxylase